MTARTMFKNIILVVLILTIAVAWLGGIFSISFSPFSLIIRKPEKDILKKAGKKFVGLIYYEATENNPPGDMLPDQIDDKVKKELKKIVN
jgi:hypothetical protein